MRFTIEPDWGKAPLLALGVAALVLLLMFAGIPSRHHQFLALLNDAGHALIFAGIAWLTLHLAGRRFLLAFLICLLVGLAIEFAQSQIGRDSSWFDLLMDAAGAGAALAFLAARADRRLRPLFLVAVTCLAVVMAPLVQAGLAYAERRAAFPELARFDRPLGTYFLRPEGVDIATVEIEGETALRMHVNRSGTPSMKLIEPARDWTGYDRLEIELANHQDHPVRVTVRVHDYLHDQEHDDRFNAHYVIDAKSRRTIEIPLAEIAAAPRERSMDLSNITDVTLFLSGRARVGSELHLFHLGLW